MRGEANGRCGGRKAGRCRVGGEQRCNGGVADPEDTRRRIWTDLHFRRSVAVPRMPSHRFTVDRRASATSAGLTFVDVSPTSPETRQPVPATAINASANTIMQIVFIWVLRKSKQVSDRQRRSNGAVDGARCYCGCAIVAWSSTSTSPRQPAPATVTNANASMNMQIVFIGNLQLHGSARPQSPRDCEPRRCEADVGFRRRGRRVTRGGGDRRGGVGVDFAFGLASHDRRFRPGPPGPA